MKDFVIKSLNGMALGLFSSLIVGLILKQLGLLLNLDFLVYIGSISQLLMGGAIGVGISYTLGFPILIIISSLIVGMYGAGSLVYLDNQVFIKLGEPIGAGVSVLVGILVAKMFSKKTKFDLILLPLVTILVGCLIAKIFSPYISEIIYEIGLLVNKTTELRPVFMGLTISVIMGIILTLPISSVAIGISLGLSGLAAGASLTGCCCQMIGFAVMSCEDNDWGTVLSIGFGTSMIQMPNIIKNPIIWIPPIVSSAILGVFSTTIFKLSSNSIASGMGTSGLVGQIATFSVNGLSYLPTMIILHFILPIILNFIIYKALKKKNYIKSGDLKI